MGSMRRILLPFVLAFCLAATATPVHAQTPPPPNYPTDLRVAANGPAMIRWAWYGGSCDEGFRVAVSMNRDMSQPRFRTVEKTWATFTGLTPGRNYYAAVRCRIGSGLSASTKVVAGRAGVVGTPYLTDRSSVSLTFAWIQYAGAVNYEVRLSRFSDVHVYRGGATGGLRTKTFNRLERDTYYYVKVRALDADRQPVSGWSPITRAATEYDPVVLPD